MYPKHTFVDCASSLRSLLKDILHLPASGYKPCLYLRVMPKTHHVSTEHSNSTEVSNSAELPNSIELLNIYVQPWQTAWTVDLYTMQSAAFTTAADDGTTLKSVLESLDNPKYFFDVRNPSHALHRYYGIKLAGVKDVQLMQVAARQHPKKMKFLNSFDKCVAQDVPLSDAQKVQMQRTANGKAVSSFQPTDSNGTFNPLRQRPLPRVIQRDCIEEVLQLAKLRGVYWSKLHNVWRQKVNQATMDRVRESQTPLYDPLSTDAAVPKSFTVRLGKTN
ncbi:hypothetical protein B0T25DRAFT_515716 [Lasiosphaeria hispida]|uniref:Uncharacterized protein n=1 Tax=Lasiosphaeria hispida TaxID=260671 RepID=A0AAJ0HSJ9_9PEZI|nr:hypothetical protein B0T25DRAFT_515716 [Lasiosphaeria hispida]